MITKLREYLDLHHITHRGFASDIGMSIATMHNVLNGKHLPNIVHTPQKKVAKKPKLRVPQKGLK